MKNSDMPDIELTTELKTLGRKLKDTQTKLQALNPSQPQDFVTQAQLQSDIDNVKTEQLKVGKIMLERDRRREAKKMERLESSVTTGEKIASELLMKLPVFADKAATAFMVLGADYRELLELSTELRKINQTLLNAGKPQVANLKVEPNNLHKLAKEAFRSSFGTQAADVFLPQKTAQFDIVEAVKGIKAECAA